jgi:hypothetical protein
MTTPLRVSTCPSSCETDSETPAQARGTTWSRRAALFGAAAAGATPLLTFATPAFAKRYPAPPIDEAVRVPALYNLRAEVLVSVRARDLEHFMSLTAKDVNSSFGGSGGRAEMRREMRENPERWRELIWVLEHGGRFQGRAFWAPYTFLVDHGNIDTFDAGVVTAQHVPARVAPRAGADIVTMLGHEVVRVVRWSFQAPRRSNAADWHEIRTPEGKKAFVEAQHIRSVVDYRVGFARSGSEWRITAFIAGD